MAGIANDWSWFESFEDVPRLALEDLNQPPSPSTMGPHDRVASEWIAQLTELATTTLPSLDALNELLDLQPVDLTVIGGLGSPGLVLLRGRGVTHADTERVLANNEIVASFSRNSIVEGQSTPNDPEFLAGQLPGIELIGAGSRTASLDTAWQKSTGSLSTVVGVIDGGIDATHPDLFLNIWLNQGEIPRRFLDELEDIDGDGRKDSLSDTDGDGLITFWDLNNLRVIDSQIYVASTVTFNDDGSIESGELATPEQTTTATPYAETGAANAKFVEDRIPNGRIDVMDLFDDPNWADGRDTDGNSFADDLFGVNFRSGGDDPFPSNQPFDELGHGSHVSGTVGAVGNNGFGIVGVNWQTSLMALRILDNDNRSDAAAAIRAINYAKEMRRGLTIDVNGSVRSGANVRVLNNSWGQPGGFEPAFEAAIRELGEVGTLFVAASGNGNILGNGVDNDTTPFYPASYQADNVIAVAALSSSGDKLASFSNFGATSVDLAAPGVGVLSTLPGGRFGPANGTSMAAPHVSGTAALIWAALPASTVAEVKEAILKTAKKPSDLLNGSVSTGGHVNVSDAIGADVFALAARLVSREDIKDTGIMSSRFTVEYSHRDGIDTETLGNDDLLVTRQWGPEQQLHATFVHATSTPDGSVRATYSVKPDSPETKFENDVSQTIGPNSDSEIVSSFSVAGLPVTQTPFRVDVDIPSADLSALSITLIDPSGKSFSLYSPGDQVGTNLNASFGEDTPLETTDPNGMWRLILRYVDAPPSIQTTLDNWSLRFDSSFDPLDFGDYVISTRSGNVKTKPESSPVSEIDRRDIGSFHVRIDDPNVKYVNTFSDVENAAPLENPNSLRDAIIFANNSKTPTTIILDTGTYTIDIPHVKDDQSPFPDPDPLDFCGTSQNNTGWSNATTGDFDIEAHAEITIVGNKSSRTVIDGGGLDRVFKVHPNARLDLSRVTVTGGVSPADQGGGGILSAGHLTVNQSILRENRSRGTLLDPIRGGGLAVWAGTAEVDQSSFERNQSDYGGGIFFCGTASGTVSRSTLSANTGGGLHSHSDDDVSVSNSTFSANSGGRGAVFNGKRDGFSLGQTTDRAGDSGDFVAGQFNELSSDGNSIAFVSGDDNVVANDNNRQLDVFVYDFDTGRTDRVSVSSDGAEANHRSNEPSISSDGRFVAFHSIASNLTEGDEARPADLGRDVFVFNRHTRQTERVSVGSDGTAGNSESRSPSISADGRYVAFLSDATNLVPNDTTGNATQNAFVYDVFVHDRETKETKRISVSNSGEEANASSLKDVQISGNGRFVVFSSTATNLVPQDTNEASDVFVYDLAQSRIERVSVNSTGIAGNGFSEAPSISFDGRYIAFNSGATNLGGTNSTGTSKNIFLRDRLSGTTTLISKNDEDQPGNAFSLQSSISETGRYIAFKSFASNLVDDDDDGVSNLFVVDRCSEQPVAIPCDEEIPQTIGVERVPNEIRVGNPSLSADGQRVSFLSNENVPVSFHSNVFDFGTGELTKLIPMQRTTSTVALSQSTIAFNDDAPFSVAGAVTVNDVLFSQNRVTADTSDDVVASNVVRTLDLGADLIGPLTLQTGRTPVHPLLLGNPAIDRGDQANHKMLDQLLEKRDLMPDIGAVEAIRASVTGTVFVDFNANQLLDDMEPGLEDILIHSARVNDGALIDTQVSHVDNARTIVDETGFFEFDLAPDTYSFEIEPPDDWTVSTQEIERVLSNSVEPNQGSGLQAKPAISSDLRFIAFKSFADNLVPGDTNDNADLFIYDRRFRTIERLTDESEPTVSTPSISGDGRFVAFSSLSSFEDDDVNGKKDVYVLDRQKNIFERVSLTVDGEPRTNDSRSPHISSDGRFVAYHSIAFGSTETSQFGIFVYDRTEKTTSQVSNVSQNQTIVASTSNDGTVIAFQAGSEVFVFENGDLVQEIPQARDVDLSGNGKFVAYSTTFINGKSQIIVHDRETGTSRTASVNLDGEEGDGVSFSPSLSDNGRFVSFVSTARNLVPNDENDQNDIFVADLASNEISLERRSVDRDGLESNNDSRDVVISGDGRLILFHSGANNLVAQDSNDQDDLFFVANPLIEPGSTKRVRAGELITDLNFGISPNPGEISGVLFQDVIENRILDPREPVFEGWTVFLDLNRDGAFQVDEPAAITGSDGSYILREVPAFRDYTVAVQAPVGFEQVLPDSDDDFTYDFFLPAGSAVAGRNFGFREIAGTGQSSNSLVSGRVFIDHDQDNEFDPGEGVPNVEIYLDRENIGERDPDEERTTTDANGHYEIGRLTASVAIVSTDSRADEPFTHSSPLGNSFELALFPLFDQLEPFGNPQSIVAANFDGDDQGFLDIAVALSESNTVSIRINDGTGGFSDQKIDIDLGIDGVGPTSIAVGQFNGSETPLDIAVTNNFSSNVTVLTDFNGSGFESKQTIAVGEEPLDIVAGAIGGDAGHLDLVLINKAENSVQVLFNDNGLFSASSVFDSGGELPTSVVLADLIGDENLDIAVANAAPSGDSPSGDLRVFRGDGGGVFTLTETRYEVGATPVDLITADFDNDGQLDLAVSNFSSNSISVLIADKANETFEVQQQTLGTASGAFDIAAADIDNDDDIDIIASNLLDRNLSIFRNDTADGDDETRFQPLEAVGLGQFGTAQRMPLVLANFDQDTSAPNGEGTIDIVTIPTNTDTLHRFTNTLVNGAHRVALDGSASTSVENLDFVVRPTVLLPSFDSLENPGAIIEDAPLQTIVLTGIRRGRAALSFSATSSDPNVIDDDDLSIEFTDGDPSATLRFKPLPDASGDAILTISLRDAGVDPDDPADDGVVSQTVTVSVLPVNDPPEFNIPARLDLLEDSLCGRCDDFATGASAGTNEEQELSDYVFRDLPEIFIDPPSIDSQGTLTFQLKEHISGRFVVNVSLSDEDGEGTPLSTTTKSFVLNIAPVNDRPSIRIGEDQTVLENAGPQAVEQFASGFAPGGGEDESEQEIKDFLVELADPDDGHLFLIPPMISADGTLSYTPAPIADGKAKVNVQVRDSGGTLRNGTRLSELDTFYITVLPTPDTTPPTPVIATNQPSLTNQTVFNVTIDFGEPVSNFSADHLIAIGATISPEVIDLGDGRFQLVATVANDGEVVFSVDSGRVSDNAGNLNFAATPLELTVVSSAIVPITSTNENDPTSNESFLVSVEFGRPVLGFVKESLAVNGATVTELVDKGNGNFDVELFAPNDGLVSLIVSNRAARDSAGNDSRPSAPRVIRVDTTPPVPAITSLAPTIVTEDFLLVEVDFGEEVVGIEASDLVLSFGHVETLTEIGPGRFLVRVGELSTGIFTLGVAQDAAEDHAGNRNLASNVLTRTIDTDSRDFGDAPDSFPTSLANNGASHIIGNLFLGAGVSAEQDGRPSSLADADNDNGVQFVITPVASPNAATIGSVKVTASDIGMLDAWIDFNRDGDWEDDGEQIFASENVAVGTNLLPYEIPAGASAGNAFARFRISRDGGLQPGGDGPEGEVEDLRVLIADAASEPEIQVPAGLLGDFFVETTTDNQIQLVSETTVFARAPHTDVSGITANRSGLSPIRVDSSLQQIRLSSISGTQVLTTLVDTTLDFAAQPDLLGGISQIDLAQGDVQLTLDAESVRALADNGKLTVESDHGDLVEIGPGWEFDRVELANGKLLRVIAQDDLELTLDGFEDYTNPINQFDVNQDGSVSASDALAIINELGRRNFSNPDGRVLDPATVDLSILQFYDISGDLQISSLDALLAINQLSRQATQASGEDMES